MSWPAVFFLFIAGPLAAGVLYAIEIVGRRLGRGE